MAENLGRSIIQAAIIDNEFRQHFDLLHNFNLFQWAVLYQLLYIIFRIGACFFSLHFILLVLLIFWQCSDSITVFCVVFVFDFSSLPYLPCIVFTMFCTVLLPVFSSLPCIVLMFPISSTCSCTPFILFCILYLFSHHYLVYPCVFNEQCSDSPLNSFVFCGCFFAITLCFPYVFSGQSSPNFTMFCTILAPISHSLSLHSIFLVFSVAASLCSGAVAIG